MMSVHDRGRLTLAIFCRVVDNYGDIGICWRLSRQLCQEYDVTVTLWVDDLASFGRICPEVVTDTKVQYVAGVCVRHWSGEDQTVSPDAVADVVIEFFGCDIPLAYIAAMAQRDVPPVWLNLEGLTAEEWVEGCHLLPSMHPRLPLTKYFFFPGFTEKTGGLLCEEGLDERRDAFQADRMAQVDFLKQFGLEKAQIEAFKITLFCYPHAPVTPLFSALQAGRQATTCLVFEDVAVDAVEDFLQKPAAVGAMATRGALTVRVLPFVAQDDYDRFLWACDINFVRGEDSFVRAQWARRPFVWHIYPQDEKLHHKKLHAFLMRYAKALPALTAFSRFWNAVEDDGEVRHMWETLQDCLPDAGKRAKMWRGEMMENGHLADNLWQFCHRIRQESRCG